VVTTARDLPKAVVPSVLKAARLLDEVAASREALSLGDLAARLALPKSSTLGLCTSLTVCGLLKRFDDGTYHLGTHLVDLAHAYLSRTDLTKEFAQALDALGAFEEEGAVLAVRDGADVVYVACRNGNLPVGISYRIGMRLPASCTATGKALISTLSDQEIKQLYRGKRLPRLTAKSCRGVGALLEELHTVRRQGYAMDNEETRDGMCCLGVPIGDPADGPAVAAVAVSMLKGSGTARKREQAVATLKELAQMLLHRLKMLR
jgi:DNA-binding IclR family transcriptional regulator